MTKGTFKLCCLFICVLSFRTLRREAPKMILYKSSPFTLSGRFASSSSGKRNSRKCCFLLFVSDASPAFIPHSGRQASVPQGEPQSFIDPLSFPFLLPFSAKRKMQPGFGAAGETGIVAIFDCSLPFPTFRTPSSRTAGGVLQSSKRVRAAARRPPRSPSALF